MLAVDEARVEQKQAHALQLLAMIIVMICELIGQHSVLLMIGTCCIG